MFSCFPELLDLSRHCVHIFGRTRQCHVATFVVFFRYTFEHHIYLSICQRRDGCVKRLMRSELQLLAALLNIAGNKQKRLRHMHVGVAIYDLSM